VEITLTSALATRQASAETIDAPKAIETSTFDSGSTTTSSEATAPTTAEPNGGMMIFSSVSFLHVFAVGLFHLVIVAF
jgi:hypothetical protein